MNPQHREVLLSTSRFDIERVSQKLQDGTHYSREVIRHPGAVVIVPVLDDGRLCLIRNYRISVAQELIELPAGTLEPNEPPIETARRELIEETGYRCSSIQSLCSFFMSPGILDEHMFVYVASGLTEGQPARELGEQISNLLVTSDQALDLIKTGGIKDGKSIASLLYYLRFSN